MSEYTNGMSEAEQFAIKAALNAASTNAASRVITANMTLLELRRPSLEGEDLARCNRSIANLREQISSLAVEVDHAQA